MTGSGKMELTPRPSHVPPDLVVDFDYRDFPGHDSDVHLAARARQPHAAFGGEWRLALAVDLALR
jgi:hypothetical protein